MDKLRLALTGETHHDIRGNGHARHARGGLPDNIHKLLATIRAPHTREDRIVTALPGHMDVRTELLPLGHAVKQARGDVLGLDRAQTDPYETRQRFKGIHKVRQITVPLEVAAIIPKLDPDQDDFTVPPFDQACRLTHKLLKRTAPGIPPGDRDLAKAALVIAPVLDL